MVFLFCVCICVCARAGASEHLLACEDSKKKVTTYICKSFLDVRAAALRPTHTHTRENWLMMGATRGASGPSTKSSSALATKR